MFTDFFSYRGGNSRLLLTTALLAGTLFTHPAQAQIVDPQATPAGENLVAGQATFNRPAAGRLDVNQTSERAVINWENFNIGENATTAFTQPSATSLAVNRVTGEGTDPTQILGTLNSNGNIMVLDRNGILFGDNAVIDVGGIIASTGDVLDTDVTDLDGQLLITDIVPGTIENNGTITVADAGLAALVAPTVRNAGTINANTGRVSLGAGTTTTVDFFGDDLISLAVADDLQQTLIDNTGRINAQGGTVSFTTAAAEDVVENVINTGGIANATSATVDGLKIVLTGTPQEDPGTGINLGNADIDINRSETGRTLALTGALDAVPPTTPPPTGEDTGTPAEIPSLAGTDNTLPAATDNSGPPPAEDTGLVAQASLDPAADGQTTQ